MNKEKRNYYVPKIHEIENIIGELDQRLIGINHEILGEDHGKRLGKHIITRSNKAGFKNDRVDELLDLYDVEFDQNRRIEIILSPNLDDLFKLLEE